MQLIEVSDLGVRSAVLYMRKVGGPIELVVYLMLHVGSPEFYSEIMRRLDACDLVSAFESVEDLPSREDVLMYEPTLDQLNETIVRARDATLLCHIDAVLAAPGKSSRKVAVVFGAEHARAVTRHLGKRHGYHVAEAEWLRVFEHES